MAALAAILKALRRAVGRDLAGSFRSNNILFLALLGGSAEALFLLIGFLLLFPLSADPLRKVPPGRLALWPLSAAERWGLRVASLALSPVLWIGSLILVKTRRAGLALLFVALALGIQAALALGRQMVKRDRHWDLLRDMPRFPGKLGGLVRKDIREFLTLLDPYAAALLAAGGVSYRLFAAHPDPMASSIVALLVALVLSTCTQSQFGLDLDSGVTRYHLLPLKGWEILVAKDAAFLTMLLLLVLPLDPAPGITFGLTALAIGHHSSVLTVLPQRRWRFASGQLPFGAFQTAVSLAMGFVEHQRGVLVLLAAFAGYVVSVWYYGRRWTQAE